jgi:hypothetical protein
MPAEPAAVPSPVDPNPAGPSADPVPSSASLAPVHPALIPPIPTGPPLPTESRALLTLIATLASDAVRASNEKLGIANAVYNTVRFIPPLCLESSSDFPQVDNHLRTLDALISQHKSTLPHQPTPTPSTPPLQRSPSPQHPASSPSPRHNGSPVKTRARRRTRAGEDKDGDEADAEGDAEHHTQSIPPLRLTRIANATTPTTIRIRNRSGSKPKPKDAGEEGGGSPSRKVKSVPLSKGASNSGSSKGMLSTPPLKHPRLI